MAGSIRSTTPTRSGLHPECYRYYRPPGSRTLEFVAAKWRIGRESSVATPLETWVEEAARLTKPDRVVHCDGSEAEYRRMIAEMLRGGDTYAINEKTYPNFYLSRSTVVDGARSVPSTNICTTVARDPGRITI